MKKVLGFSSAVFCTVVLLVGLVGQASAGPVIYCKDGPGGLNTVSINLVTQGCISGDGDGFYDNAGGGDPLAKVVQAIGHATGTTPVGLTLYGKSDDNPALFSFSGVSPAALAGTWDILNNLIGVRYITIKAANSYALYDVGGANSGTFSTMGILNNGGQQPVVSHISFWGPASIITTPSPTPEPSILALLGIGLLGLSLSRRRMKV